MSESDPRIDELTSGRDTDLHSHSFDRVPTQDTRISLDAVERVRTVTTNYTATTLDEVIAVDTTAGAVTVTLPTPRGGKRFVVTRVAGAFNVTVQSVSGTINGAATAVIATSWLPLRLKHYLSGYMNV